MADAGAAKARAEQFEDEKRRIVDSCFGKINADGSRKSQLVLSESCEHILLPLLRAHLQSSSEQSTYI